MTDGPGRTYKYLKDPSQNSLWSFAFGLSYTTFSLSSPSLSSTVLHANSEAAAIQSSITVKNTGHLAGDEVVFLFKKSAAPTLAWHQSQRPNDPPPQIPVRELIAFERVSLAPGASTTVKFNTTIAKLSTVDTFGTRHVLPGEHHLVFSRGHGEELSTPVMVELPEQLHGGRLIISTMVGLFGKGANELGLSAHDEL